MPLLLARLLAVAGSAAIAVGAFLPWIVDTSANHLPVDRLFGGDMERETDRLLTTVALVLVVAAAVGLIGALLPSRIFGFVGGLVATTTVALLVVAEYRFVDVELGEFASDVVGAGLWCAGIGAVVLLLSSLALRVDVQSELVTS